MSRSTYGDDWRLATSRSRPQLLLMRRFVNDARIRQRFNIGVASSVAKWGITRLRVALVLDNTGSMDERRQDDRPQDRDQEFDRPAARLPSPQDGDVYVSIIPFAKDVNRRAKYELQPRIGSTGRYCDSRNHRPKITTMC